MTHLKSHISTTTIPLQTVNEDTSAGKAQNSKPRQLTNNLKIQSTTYTIRHGTLSVSLSETYTIRYGTGSVSLNETQYKTPYSPNSQNKNLDTKQSVTDKQTNRNQTKI